VVSQQIRKEVTQSVAKSPEPVPSNAGQVQSKPFECPWRIGLSPAVPAGSVLSASQAPDFQPELRKEQASQEPQTFPGEKLYQFEAEDISKTFCHHCSGNSTRKVAGKHHIRFPFGGFLKWGHHGGHGGTPKSSI